MTQQTDSELERLYGEPYCAGYPLQSGLPTAQTTIQKLAQQSGIARLVDSWEYEKFAQLVVRECLNQCVYRGMNDELYAGQLNAAEYIEQHFGVKE